MADSSITVELEGDAAAGGDLQLGQFIEELTAVRNALRQTERNVLRRDESTVRYRVTNLSHSSPARVTITMSSREPVYRDVPRRISRRFRWALNTVRRDHRYAERLDLRTLETFKAIAAPAVKHNIRVLVSTEREQNINLDRAFDTRLTRLIAGDEREKDEIVGKVDRVDIHNKNTFDIYPVVGPKRVRCNAPKRLLDQVVASVGKYVSVEGVALYRKDAPFPYALKVEAIHPRRPDRELPTMQSLHGTMPNATDGLSAEDFVRKFRNDYW